MRKGRVTAGLLVLVVALAAAPASAWAQEDPYGSTTTTTAPPAVLPTCELSVTGGAPGASVTATVRNAPQGQTVQILFGGDEVGRGSADVGEGEISVQFVVPDRPPGEYLVTAVGGTFTVECGSEAGGTFSVLAAAEEQGGGGPLPRIDSGSLPRTGIYVGLALVVAAALLLAGRSLLAASRRRAGRIAQPRTRAEV